MEQGMMYPVLVKLGAKLEPQKMKPPRLIGCVGHLSVAHLKSLNNGFFDYFPENMEPKDGGLEDDFPLQTGDFQIFSGSMLVCEGVIVAYTRA